MFGISAHPWLVGRRKETSRNWSNLFSPKSGDSRRQAENKQDSVGRPQSALHCSRLNVAELPLCVMAVSLIEIAGRVDTKCNTVIWMAQSSNIARQLFQMVRGLPTMMSSANGRDWITAQSFQPISQLHCFSDVVSLPHRFSPLFSGSFADMNCTNCPEASS